VTPGALALLASMRMFGNVRDMENCIEMLSLKAPPGDIVIDEATVERVFVAPPARPTRDAGIEAERQAVEEAMRKAGGNRSVAARMLGVSLRTLYNKLEGLGLLPVGNEGP
jgi:DNA-binding NtrC family response regulator